MLFCVLGLVGCVAIVAVGVDNAVDELNAEQERHAITEEQFNAIETGITQEDLITTLGKEPESTQEFVSEGVFSAEELRSGCVYYNRSGGEWGDTYQFCFDGNLLSSKNAYG